MTETRKGQLYQVNKEELLSPGATAKRKEKLLNKRLHGSGHKTQPEPFKLADGL